MENNPENKEKGITSASLDRPGERKFKKLEEQMVKDENKFIFKDQADQDKFFYFRNLNKENLTAIYEEEPSFHKILTETKYDPRKLIEGEYNRILNVAENLGTEKFASFNSKFGHIDTQENSNIFSLRLKPVTNYDSEKNKILVEVNPRMRALLCKQTDGKIRVLQIYNKDSFIDSVGFAEYEKDLFQKARDKIKAEKINCLKPKP